MDTNGLMMLVAQGLAAMKAGGQIAAEATGEIQDDASNPELKAALAAGNDTSKRWAQRIEQALREAEGNTEQPNPIVESLYEVSRTIRHQAPDDAARDLGIIANGQLALHYWIAAFGTMRTYATQLGMSETAHAMQTSLDEAKQADEQHTSLAKKIMAASG